MIDLLNVDKLILNKIIPIFCGFFLIFSIIVIVYGILRKKIKKEQEKNNLIIALGSLTLGADVAMYTWSIMFNNISEQNIADNSSIGAAVAVMAFVVGLYCIFNSRD